MEKLLSVVIPTYNMESLLPRCIDSLVKPYCNEALEVLIVNDGSKDNSLKIANSYADKYPTIIKVIDKENGNYGSAVNKGIEAAKGKYFRILDADDFYSNEGLNALIKELSSIDTDIVLTNYRRERGNEYKLFCASEQVYGIEKNFDTIDLDNFPNYAMHGLTIKTSILREHDIKLQHGISYTDIEFCFYPLPYIKTFVAFNILVYRYQLGREGQTVDVSSQIKSVSHMEKIANRMFEYIYHGKFDKSTFKKLRQHFCDICTLYLMTILCFCKKDTYSQNIEDLIKKIQKIEGAEQIMRTKKLYGISFFNRYITEKKFSNSALLKTYYSLVRRMIPLYSTFKKILSTSKS